MSPLGIALGLVAMGAKTAVAQDAPDPLVLSGERWRLEVRRDQGTFDFAVQPGEAGDHVSVLRPGGEPPWYGYNHAAGGEIRTSDVRPDDVRRGGEAEPIAVRCPLDTERGVVHDAQYYALGEGKGVLVMSRFAAEAMPDGVSIVRAAPKLDVNVELLTHYAFVDPSGRRHGGAIADLGGRDTYAGAGGWGGGDVVPSLNTEYPYMLLYSPEGGVSLGIILPFYRSVWRGVRSFLQLYQGGHNFWYMGFMPPTALGKEHAFILHTRQSGSPEAIHADAPGLCEEAAELIASGAVDAPELRAMLDARREFQAQYEGLLAEASGRPPTRQAWLAVLMIRAAAAGVDEDAGRALELLGRARGTIGLD